MAGRLVGKVAVVTGAASGIGRALALAFAAEGAEVVAVDIDAAGLRSVESGRITSILADVRDDGAVRALMDGTATRLGHIDILFNNAGVGARRRIEELPEGEFEAFVAVHLFGALYGLRAALPHMRRQGHGRIVNTVSRAAVARAPGWAAYGSAKAALVELTRVAAAECADVDILVNGMIPGPTATGMNHGPDLQSPEAVVPSALWLATLPAGGPSGKIFWNMNEYELGADRAPAAKPAGDRVGRARRPASQGDARAGRNRSANG